MYYSNCLIEAIRAKIRWGKKVDIIYVPAKINDVYCPHFMWHDLTNDTIKDFHCDEYLEKWWNLYLYKGYIRTRPYSAYERWIRTKM